MVNINQFIERLGLCSRYRDTFGSTNICSAFPRQKGEFDTFDFVSPNPTSTIPSDESLTFWMFFDNNSFQTLTTPSGAQYEIPTASDDGINFSKKINGTFITIEDNSPHGEMNGSENIVLENGDAYGVYGYAQTGPTRWEWLERPQQQSALFLRLQNINAIRRTTDVFNGGVYQDYFFERVAGGFVFVGIGLFHVANRNGYYTMNTNISADERARGNDLAINLDQLNASYQSALASMLLYIESNPVP